MLINIADQQIELPETWNEFSLKTQLICYGILMSKPNALFDVTEELPAKRLALTKYLLNLDEAFFQKWRQDCIDNDDGEEVFVEELDDLCKKVTACFFELVADDEADGERYQIALTLTKCPWPELKRDHKSKKGKKVTYLAPSDGLKNISFYELTALFSIFEAWAKTGNEDLVHRLLAILYRPHKPKTKANKRSGYNGDKRLPYLHHEATVEKRMQEMQQLPPQMKQLVVFWFASCRQEIIKKYPRVFQTGEGGSDGLGWGAVLTSLAGGIVHLDAVAEQNHGNALMYLTQLDVEAEKAELRAAEAKMRT